jgi:hypothetical protein
MTTQNYLAVVQKVVILTIVCMLWVMVRPMGPAQAGGGGPQLPPRNPPPTDPLDRDDGADDHDPPPGAYIELQTQDAPPAAWTVVQWQDQAGGWHDVEGWQGTLETNHTKRWWVTARDFGKGSFRWVVTDSRGGRLLANSVSFDLPDEAYEVVRVQVVLNP